ncbi:GntR family transcriptional regulator YhfZ [Streptomyces inhibens]|uniref:GntR family transcriptional regulator YhfZ n=1 Tax=Streptomyces inhibens TaxID=2293571 RepID=UPI001EE6DE0E|nr:GntR family transcriptional regulator YhfZ [Streptomyces inhibens]UKY52933.1 GntR family transcriptional regulator [Streptomyces inhibens]
MNGSHGSTALSGIDARFLTRNGHAARQLAALLVRQGADGVGGRLPRVRDFAERLGVGNGTVQAGLRLLEEAGAIKTVARGHLGTFLVAADRAALWRLSGLGTLLAAMPLPYSRRYEGLATGLRVAFEEAGAPFAMTFRRGAAARVAALVEGKVELAVLSRFAADRMVERQPVELIADLGPATYAGAHGVLLRPGATLGSPRLRVAVDDSSEDQRMLAERFFAHRTAVEWVPCSPVQLREVFAQGRADATVWNLDEVPGQLGSEVQVLPLGDELTRDLAVRHASAALIGRAQEEEGAGALAAVRDVLDLSTVTAVQGEVLRGERVPAY